MRATLDSEGTVVDQVAKLDELLRAAIEAEANGDPAEDIARAEDEAKQFVLFSGNGFSYFGSADQIPKKVYTTEELKDAGVDPAALLQTDDTTEKVRRGVLAAATFGGAAWIVLLQPPAALVNSLGFSLIVGVVVDLLVNQGNLQGLILDSLARAVNPGYADRVLQHEAARFLVGYLIGVLPKAYSLTAADALARFESTNIKAGCVFCTAKLQSEIASGKLSGKTLDRFVCLKLAGIAQEYLTFGQAQSGAFGITQIEDLFKALEFEQRRSKDETVWGMLNVISILRKHKQVHQELAQAMQGGAPVAKCIALVERRLSSEQEP